MGNSESASDRGIGITIDDLRSFDFERVLSKQGDNPDGVEGRTCSNYSKNFVEESKLAESEGDHKRETICDLFAILTSLRFYFNDEFKKPFPPPDINEEYLEPLQQIVPELEDPELRARIADILWYLRIDMSFQYAELAVDAYLETGTRFDRVDASSDRALRIERALQIAAALGRKGQKYTTTIDFIETELKEMKEANILYGPARLLSLLREHQQGDSEVYIPYASYLAEEFENKNGWEGAREIWYIARDWHRFAEDDKGARCAERRAAMTYEPEALGWMKLGTHTHFKVIELLQRGVTALRNSGASQDDVKRVHALFLEKQASYDDHKEVSFSVDITESVQTVKRSFRDRSVADCIYGLAADIKPPSVKWLKAQADELQSKHQMQYLFTKRLVDEQGKVIGKRPGNTYDDNNGLENSIRITMYEQAKHSQRATAFCLILPALEQINLDHHISPNDLVDIVTNSPFIPPDRQHIFLRGLYHGFVLDFMVASSLLVPQIENSIRYVLQQHSVIVSKYDSDGIQEEYNLGNLLYKVPQVKETFGQDLLFDLQGLLQERFGSNFRNRLAHGLVTDNEYMSWSSAYAWGLVLHLCCAPLLARQSAVQNAKTANNDVQQTDDETQDSESV